PGPRQALLHRSRPERACGQLSTSAGSLGCGESGVTPHREPVVEGQRLEDRVQSSIASAGVPARGSTSRLTRNSMVPPLLRLLPECEAQRRGTGIEELDLELPVGDAPLLSNELVEPRFAHDAV